MILSNRSNVESVEDFAQKLNLDYIANAKKPLQSGFKQAINKLNEPKENVILVGDQIFTDILGAKLARIKSALVEPLDKNEPTCIRIKRFFEKIFRAYIKCNIKRRKLNEKNDCVTWPKLEFDWPTRNTYIRQ